MPADNAANEQDERIYAVTVEQTRRKTVLVHAANPEEAAIRGRTGTHRIARDSSWIWRPKHVRIVHEQLGNGRLGAPIEVAS